jgi:hypothetical protein
MEISAQGGECACDFADSNSCVSVVELQSSTSRARLSASHALAATICSSSGLVSSPSLSFVASPTSAFWIFLEPFLR